MFLNISQIKGDNFIFLLNIFVVFLIHSYVYSNQLKIVQQSTFFKSLFNSAIGPKLAAHIHYFFHIIPFLSVRQIWAPMFLVSYTCNSSLVSCGLYTMVWYCLKMCVKFVRFFMIMYVVLILIRSFFLAVFYKMTCN